MDIDYTFNNLLIKAYFNGDDSYVPLGELKYLHSHPLVAPNFLTEIDALILRAGKIMLDYKLNHLVEHISNDGIIIGKSLIGDSLEIDDQSGLDMLQALRRIYVLCNDVIGKLGSVDQVP